MSVVGEVVLSSAERLLCSFGDVTFPSLLCQWRVLDLGSKKSLGHWFAVAAVPILPGWSERRGFSQPRGHCCPT